MTTNLPHELRSARLTVLAALAVRLGELEPARHAVDTALSRLRDADEDVVAELVPAAWREAGLSEEPPALDAEDEQPALVLLTACCHPSLPEAARIALVLSIVAGLPTAEVARAFAVPDSVMAQRLAWAQNRVQPVLGWTIDPEEAEAQLCRVLDVLLLIFDDGVVHPHTHVDLPAEALGITRVIVEIFHSSQEPRALLSLMVLTRARRDARRGTDGALVPLESQDRSRWHRDEIDEGLFLLRSSRRAGRNGPHQVRAAIQAEHVTAADAQDTDWERVLSLHDELLQMAPSDAVILARATAMAAARGPQTALDTIERLGLDTHLYHATRAHLLRMLDRPEDADHAWTAAVSRVRGAQEHARLRGEMER